MCCLVKTLHIASDGQWMPRNPICIIDWLGEGHHGSSFNCSTVHLQVESEGLPNMTILNMKCIVSSILCIQCIICLTRTTRYNLLIWKLPNTAVVSLVTLHRSGKLHLNYLLLPETGKTHVSAVAGWTGIGSSSIRIPSSLWSLTSYYSTRSNARSAKGRI